MEINECRESVSEETMEKWYQVSQEEQFRELKLRKTTETVNKFVDLHFKNTSIFLSKELISEHSQLLKDSSKMIRKQTNTLKGRIELMKKEEPTEKIYLSLIQSSKNSIEEIKSFQDRADNLVNRCIDYTPENSAAH